MTPTPDTPNRTPEEIEKPLSNTIFHLGSDAQAADAWQKIVDAIPRDVQSDWEAIDYLRTLIRWTLGEAPGLLVAAATENVRDPEKADDPTPGLSGIPTEEQVERAARAILPGRAWWEPVTGDCDPRWPDEQRRAQDQARREARAALTAAAGVAPQEPSVGLTPPELASRTGDGSCSNPDCPLTRAHSGPCAPPPDRERLITDLQRRRQQDRHARSDYVELLDRTLEALSASLVPEKVGGVIHRAEQKWQMATGSMTRLEYIARALCEAHKEGRLT